MTDRLSFRRGRLPLALPRALAFFCTVLALIAMAAPAWAAKIKTSPINLDTQPPGAEVTLLEPAPSRLLGLTPLKKVAVPQGPVKISIKLAGYEDKVETVTVAAKLTTFNFQLVRKIMPATLDLGGDAAALGAEVAVDGEVKGKLPIKVSVAPGRHQIVVRKAGFVNWEKWAEVTENQTATFEVVLKAQEKPKGSLLVSSAPAGAEVRLNGAPKGKAPQVIENLDAGNYEVDLSLDGHKSFRQTVQVREGQRETVSGVLEASTGPTGELTVLCDAPKAVIFVDGEDKGSPPARISGLKAGDHVVECRAPNYPPASQVLAVKAGEVKTAQLSPRQAVAASRGSISVVASIPAAQARIGDGEWKKTPAMFDDLPPGKYLVTVRADGYANFSDTVTVEAQRSTEVSAKLQAMGKIEVSAPLGKKGQVYLDGAVKGSTPLTLDVAEGAHKVKIIEDGPGGSVEEFDVPVLAGQTAKVAAKMIPPPPPRIVRRSNPMSAHVNDVGKGTVQVGVGMPAPIQIAISAGVVDDVAAGMDVSISGVINEFVLTGAYRVVGTNAFAFGVQGGLGGGLGPSERNSFTMHVKPVASLLLGDTSSFSIYGQFRFWSDRYNGDPDVKGKPKDRDTGWELPIGLQGEFMVTPRLNAWGKLEMDFFNPSARKIYDDNALTHGLNQKIRGGIGITWLFN
jgi:hypothetical protein